MFIYISVGSIDFPMFVDEKSNFLFDRLPILGKCKYSGMSNGIHEIFTSLMLRRRQSDEYVVKYLMITEN